MNQNEMPWNDPSLIIPQTEPKGPPTPPEPAASDPSPPAPDLTDGPLAIQDVRDTLTLTKEGRVMQAIQTALNFYVYSTTRNEDQIRHLNEVL